MTRRGPQEDRVTLLILLIFDLKGMLVWAVYNIVIVQKSKFKI